jgi:hypothetical protein
MLESGLIVFSGVLLLLIKLPKRWLLVCLGRDLVLDVAVSVLAFALHFGTFSGVMAASVAGLLMSLATTAMKRLFGFIRAGVYTPGFVTLRF